jgi:hypothetical protein
MGIGDFGVGQGGNPYTYSTSEFLGNFSWQNMNIQESGDTYFSDQLNVVLQFVQSGVTYAYWIQDVAFMDSSSKNLQFENNIWNMTTSSSCLDNTAVTGNGTVYPISGCVGYYAVGATTQPGANENMPTPGDFGVLVKSYMSGSGTPEVAFEYWDGVTNYYVTYDNVVWPWATATSADNNFVVDGFNYNPGGWFYDAELAIGGPGGGSSTAAANPTHLTSSLEYWNGHNFEATPSVWNFGANTAETVSNIQSIFSHDPAGLPLTLQLNGTTRNATPAQAYSQNQVGEIAITATGIPSGTVAIPGSVWRFTNDAATLTLVPGLYHVWVNSTSSHTDLGECLVAAGSTTSVTVSEGCTPAVSKPAPTQGTVDLGQSVSFESTLLSPGSGGDTYTWQTSPSGLGCGVSTTLTLLCTPTNTGTYKVNLTVTDSSSRSFTSANLSFTVHADPTVGVPSPSRSTVETGAPVTFTVSPTGGASPYSFSWSGLPAPCNRTNTAAPTCTPPAPGTYPVQVNITDASSFFVPSPTLSFVVSGGPSVTTPSVTPAPSIDLGEAATFTVKVSGGSGGYAYLWEGLPSGCTPVSSASLTCTPSATGNSSVQVQVNDSAGGVGTSGTVSFAVHSDPSLGSLTALPKTVDLGQTLRFATSGPTTGGVGPYQYQWSNLPAGCSSANATSLSCVPSNASAGVAKLTVVDANHGTSFTTTSYHVYNDPSLLGISPVPASIDLGENVTFIAAGLSGGTGVFTYQWSGLPVGCLGANSSSVKCTPTASGTRNASVTITDSNGLPVQGSVGFTVYPALSVTGPASSSSSGVVGTLVSFSVTTLGGRGPLGFAWSGLPTGCTSSNDSMVECTPSASGTFYVMVNVTDANGVTVESGTLSFRVAPAPTTLLGLPLTDWYVVLGVAVAGAIGAVVVATRRVRRQSSEPPPGLA